MAPPRFRRIVVALDASPQSVAALEVAATLASHLQAELVGLYVEDSELVKLAELPRVTEIDFFSGRPRPIRARGVERQLAQYAARAHEGLRRATEGLEIRWSFRTARGRPHQQLAGFAGEADLVILGARSRSWGRGLGSTVRALLQRRDLALMVVGQGARAARGAVHVLHDGSEAADEAVVLAASLLPGGRGGVVVLAAIPGTAEGGDPKAQGAAAHEGPERMLEERLTHRLRRATSPATVRVLLVEPPTPEGAASAVARERSGWLVIPRSALEADESDLALIIRRWRSPVLVLG